MVGSQSAYPTTNPDMQMSIVADTFGGLSITVTTVIGAHRSKQVRNPLVNLTNPPYPETTKTQSSTNRKILKWIHVRYYVNRAHVCANDTTVDWGLGPEQLSR